LKIFNNTVTFKGDTLYIYIPKINILKIDELYIFLENVLSTVFYDIYKNDIENKTISEEVYKSVLFKMLTESNTKRILILDNSDNIDYNFDLNDINIKQYFIDEIVKIIF